MDGMFFIATGIVLGAILVVLFLALRKPSVFRVERRTDILAPPEKIHPLIADFSRWPAWSPYEKRDPAMKKTLSGATAGKGAIYAWDGNNYAGKGRMEITDATPSRIVIKLDFMKPFEAHNTAQFTLEGDAESTEVIWSMRGPVSFKAKIMHVFFDMDYVVGKDFEIGLANLKTLAES
jgi:hypothetical protein